MCLISASLLRRNVTAIQHVAAMNAGPASQRKLVGFSSRFEVRWSLVGAFAQMNAPFSSSFFLILFHPPFFLTLSFGGGVAISSGGKFFSFFFCLKIAFSVSYIEAKKTCNIKSSSCLSLSFSCFVLFSSLSIQNLGKSGNVSPLANVITTDDWCKDSFNY